MQGSEIVESIWVKVVPKHCGTFLWGNRNVESWKHCVTTFNNIIQLEIKDINLFMELSWDMLRANIVSGRTGVADQRPLKLSNRLSWKVLLQQRRF